MPKHIGPILWHQRWGVAFTATRPAGKVRCICQNASGKGRQHSLMSPIFCGGNNKIHLLADNVLKSMQKIYTCEM